MSTDSSERKPDDRTLAPVAGPGLLARYGDLVVLYAAPDGDDERTSAVLDAIASAASAGAGDGRRLGRQLAGLLLSAGSQESEFPALAAFGPTGDGVAAIVHGAAQVSVVTDDGEIVLDGREAFTWVDRIIQSPARVIRGSLGTLGATALDPWSRLDAGVVRAGGFVFGPPSAGNSAPRATAARPPAPLTAVAGTASVPPSVSSGPPSSAPSGPSAPSPAVPSAAAASSVPAAAAPEVLRDEDLGSRDYRGSDEMAPAPSFESAPSNPTQSEPSFEPERDGARSTATTEPTPSFEAEPLTEPAPSLRAVPDQTAPFKPSFDDSGVTLASSTPSAPVPSVPVPSGPDQSVPPAPPAPDLSEPTAPAPHWGQPAAPERDQPAAPAWGQLSERPSFDSPPPLPSPPSSAPPAPPAAFERAPAPFEQAPAPFEQAPAPFERAEPSTPGWDQPPPPPPLGDWPRPQSGPPAPLPPPPSISGLPPAPPVSAPPLPPAPYLSGGPQSPGVSSAPPWQGSGDGPPPVPAGPIAVPTGPAPLPPLPDEAAMRPASSPPSGPADGQLDRSMPFEAVLLIGETPPPRSQTSGPLPPADVQPPPGPVPADGAEEADARPTILGIYCKNDHFNDPRVPYCAVCGIGMAQLTHVSRPGPRPPLGLLVLDDGATFRLDTAYVVGREPERDDAVIEGRARALRIDDPKGVVSRIHARVELDGWDVTVTDLASANGTHIAAPNSESWTRLDPHRKFVLTPGTRVVFGRRGFRYESHRNP